MATLPWTVAADARPAAEVVYMASRLELTSARHIPGFFRAAFRIRRQVLRSPGAIGVSLIAESLHKTFWTLSAWTDDTALNTFVRTEPHRVVMGRYHDRLTSPQFIRWNADGASLPAARSNAKERWTEGKSRLAAAQHGGSTH